MCRYSTDAALFTLPASENFILKQENFEQCYTGSLSAHEKELRKAEPSFTAFIDASSEASFYITGPDYTFTNVKESKLPDAPSKKINWKSLPKLPDFGLASDYNEKEIYNYLFSVDVQDIDDSKYLKYVSPPEKSTQYGTEDLKYWFFNNAVSQKIPPNDIGLVYSTAARKQSPITAGNDKDGNNDYNRDANRFYGLYQFKKSDGTVTTVDENIWGMTLQNKSFYRTKTGRKAMLDNMFDEAIYQDYIHQMSEVFVSSTATLDDHGVYCPSSGEGNIPETIVENPFEFGTGESPESGCLLNRMVSNVMQPIFTEMVTIGGKTLYTGFTQYRTVPFMGIFEGESGTSNMLMPNDEFIKKYGGVGFGAASVVVNDDVEKVFSFGGYDYSPDSKGYRIFEKLPHGDRFPKHRSWYPVWKRKSLVHGANDFFETKYSCAYGGSDNFFRFSSTQVNDRDSATMELSYPTTAYEHSDDQWYSNLFTNQTRFFPSFIPNSQNFFARALDVLGNCSQGNIGIYYDDLISDSPNCLNYLRFFSPANYKNEKGGLDHTLQKDSPTDEFTYLKWLNFLEKKIETTTSNNLVKQLIIAQSVKYHRLMGLWASLLEIDSWDPSNYQADQENDNSYFQQGKAACKDPKSNFYQVREVEGILNNFYQWCTPADGNKPFMANSLQEDNDDNDNSEYLINRCAKDANMDDSENLSPWTIPIQASAGDGDPQDDTQPQYSYGWEFKPSMWGDSGAPEENSVFRKGTITKYWFYRSLVKLNVQRSDVLFLARECEFGNIQLEQSVLDFDYSLFNSEPIDIFQQTQTVESSGGDGVTLDLSKVFSGHNFFENLHAIHPAMHLGRLNDHRKSLCKDPRAEHDGGTYEWYQLMLFRKDRGTEERAPQYAKEMFEQSWGQTQSKFYYVTKEHIAKTDMLGDYGKLSDVCLGPYPGIIPPFKQNCDYSGTSGKPNTDRTTEWEKCPFLPNPDFYNPHPKNQSDAKDFLVSDLWRKPYLYRRFPGRNGKKIWNARAFRYDLSDFADPTPSKKIFTTQIDGTSEYVGDMQYARTGATAHLSTLDPNLIYVCGGVIVPDPLCELYSIKDKESVVIPGLEDKQFCIDATSNVRNRIVGLQIVEDNVTTTTQSVHFQFACANQIIDDKYAGIPEEMKAILFAKNLSSENNKQSVSFAPMEFVKSQGHSEARAAISGTVELQEMIGQKKISPSVCFDTPSTRLTTTITQKASAQDTGTTTESTAESIAGSSGVEGTTEDDAQINIVISVDRTTLTYQLNNNVPVKQQLVDNTRTCFNSEYFQQSGQPASSFVELSPFLENNAVNMKTNFFTVNPICITEMPFGQLISNTTKSFWEFHADRRWKTGGLGYRDNKQDIQPVAACWYDKESTSAKCGLPGDCPAGNCVVDFYDELTSDEQDDIEFNMNQEPNPLFQNQGYMTRPNQLMGFTGYKFKGEDSMIEQTGVYGRKECNAIRQVDEVMLLDDVTVYRRITQPHFIEQVPLLVVRTPEACSEATSTACHVFTATGDTSTPIKQCFHAVGCNSTQYVNTTGLNASTMETDPTSPDYGQHCIGFDICKRTISPQYLDLQQHAGIQPKCTFVRACETFGYKRSEHSFDQVIGASNKLGTCVPGIQCNPGQYERSASTALRHSQCLEITTCNETVEKEQTPPTDRSDRECVRLEECERPDRPDSCVVIEITCNDGQFFDGNECQDLTICALRQRETQAPTNTSDRICQNIEACSFSEKLVHGEGIELVCQTLKYTSETEDILSLAIGGVVAGITIIFNLLV